MQIRPSAHKHGIADVEHPWRRAARLIEYEYDGEERPLVIGPIVTAGCSRLVAVPAGEPTRIIRADRLRPVFYDCLR